MENLWGNFLLFCTPTWRSNHVDENQELGVCMWRHGGHVGVQNNAAKCLLGIWFYYYGKLVGPFSVVLYTNMAVSSRGWKPRIGGLHMTSRRPCWCTEQCSKMSFGNLILLLWKTCGAIFCCFVHQHGRLITWMQTKNYCPVILQGLKLAMWHSLAIAVNTVEMIKF